MRHALFGVRVILSVKVYTVYIGNNLTGNNSSEILLVVIQCEHLPRGVTIWHTHTHMHSVNVNFSCYFLITELQ